jgi:hypothetical protein
MRCILYVKPSELQTGDVVSLQEGNLRKTVRSVFPDSTCDARVGTFWKVRYDDGTWDSVPGSYQYVLVPQLSDATDTRIADLCDQAVLPILFSRQGAEEWVDRLLRALAVWKLDQQAEREPGT